MLGPQQERPRPNFSNMPGMEMDLGNSRIGGEFNIDAGPGLGGAVKKSQMERALEMGDSAGLLAGYGAGLGGPQKSMATRPASPPPVLGSPGRTMIPKHPTNMPTMAPPMAPGRTTMGRPGSGAARQGGGFWNSTGITPQQQAQWAGAAGSRVGTSPMGGSQSWASGPTSQMGTVAARPPVGTMTAPSPPPTMSFGPGTSTGSLPPMGPPGAPSNNAALVAAAVRSGALQKLPGESLDQAVMRILSKMGEGRNLAAARASGGGDSVIRNSLGGM